MGGRYIAYIFTHTQREKEKERRNTHTHTQTHYIANHSEIERILIYYTFITA